jgi:hypothetical protein
MSMKTVVKPEKWGVWVVAAPVGAIDKIGWLRFRGPGPTGRQRWGNRILFATRTDAEAEAVRCDGGGFFHEARRTR